MSGDAANVAARLEQAAAAGRDPDRRGHLPAGTRPRRRRGRRSRCAVKGKAEPLVAYRLLGVRPAGLGAAAGGGSPGRCVGRRRQLRLAEAMFATAVEESACVLLTVVGEPGVGKSRLVEELLAGIGADALRAARAGACRMARASPTGPRSRC